MKSDLHIHTLYSDGVFSPEKIVDTAIDVGLQAIALTDHDNVLSYPVAKEYLKKTELKTAKLFETALCGSFLLYGAGGSPHLEIRDFGPPARGGHFVLFHSLLPPQPYGTQFHSTQLRFVGSASVPSRGHNFKEILRVNLQYYFISSTVYPSE